MNWQRRRVLVTGAGGFVGSHLAERLVDAGAVVRAMVRYNALGARGWLDHSAAGSEIEVIAGDLCDRDSVLAATRGAEVVFHLAAVIAIPYSYSAPVSYVRTNVEGTLNVLQAAREVGIERLIHTSTSEAYGTARYVPIDEDHPLRGQSPYAASKIGADKLAEAFHLSFDLPIVIVRPFNIFGPRQSARAVVPTIIAQCLSERVVRLGNLHPTRDLNYVADTVEGFLLAASTPHAVGRTINLGSGRETSIEELVRMIGDIIGREVTVECDENRVRPSRSEVARLLANSTLARDLLGWYPTVGLEEGLEKTVSWIKQHSDRYHLRSYAV